MSTLTDKELQATLYFAVGVTSESRDDAYRLMVAGDRPNTPLLEPLGDSGYSIGTIQTDLGQHYAPNDPNGENVPRDLVTAYQAWAQRDPRLVLNDAQVQSTISDLGRKGHVIVTDGGRPLDATVKARLDAFLASNEGISWVHGRDVAQVNHLMTNAITPLTGSQLYQNASLDDQVRLAAVVGKVYNQNEVTGGRIVNRIAANEFASLDDVNVAVDGIMKAKGDFYETGRKDALAGADVVNALRNASTDNPMRQAWNAVLADPLVNPTALDNDRAHPNLTHQYAVIRNTFVHDSFAKGFIDALDRGASYQRGQVERDHPEQFKGAGFYTAGDDMVTWSRAGAGHAFIDNTWSAVERSNLSRVRTDDGVTTVNINENGQVRPLLRVDPHAAPLRPTHDGPNNPNHPDHAMLEQIREGVREMGASAGISFDDKAERLCHSLLAACKDNRDQYAEKDYPLSANALTRVDHVVAGPEHVFAVQGRLDDPAHLRAHVQVAQAMQTPIEQSDAKLLAANQAISQEQIASRQQAMQQTQDQAQVHVRS